MARTIRKDEDRSRLMRKYDEILKEIAELPAGFGKVEILDGKQGKAKYIEPASEVFKG